MMMMKMNNKSSSSNEEKWKIVHVPDKPPVPPHLHPTVNVYASVIDPKDANNLVRKLNKIAPLENLRHVKRVRRKCLEGGETQLSVILCLACGDDSHLDAIPNYVLELINANQYPNMQHLQKKNGKSSPSYGQLHIIRQLTISMVLLDLAQRTHNQFSPS